MNAQSISPVLQAAIELATPNRVQNQKGFDAIVVGAGAAGGFAALLLCEAGLSVLLLDAGLPNRFREAPVKWTTAAIVKGVANPALQSVLPIPIVNFGRKALRVAGMLHQPVQTKFWAWELAPDAFVDDRQNPYVNEPGSRFHWFRVHQIGGRMTVPGHGQQYYRFGERDLKPDDGLSPAWPITSAELGHWYDNVERRLRLVSGSEECPWVPSGRTAQTRNPTAGEAATMAALRARWPNIHSLLGRAAPPLSSVEMAAATGRLICRQGAIVSEVRIGRDGRASGVVWRDRATGAEMSAKAPIVFVCASALESTRILLSSRSASGESIGSRSGALGAHLMDHVIVYCDGIGGAIANGQEPFVQGRCVYLPRFDLREGQTAKARGYGVQIHRWSMGPSRSHMTAVSFGEMTPRKENRVVLDRERKDAWGLPVLRIACRHDDAELDRAKEQSAGLKEIADVLGVRLYRLNEAAAPAGTAVHECGTARMGDSPESSVLDPFNQCWDAKGIYVTDAAAFPSQGIQNPTLTILALTARACAHAVAERSASLQRAAQPAPASADRRLRIGSIAT